MQYILTNAINMNNLTARYKVSVYYITLCVIGKQNISWIDMRWTSSENCCIIIESLSVYIACTKNAFSVKYSDCWLKHFHSIAYKSLVIAANPNMTFAIFFENRFCKFLTEVIIKFRICELTIHTHDFHNDFISCITRFVIIR